MHSRYYHRNISIQLLYQRATLHPACLSARYLLQANAEAPEDLLHVAALLHGNDAQVILLIHPNQERLVVIVPGGRRRF